MVNGKPTHSVFVDWKYTDVYQPIILSKALSVPQYRFSTAVFPANLLCDALFISFRFAVVLSHLLWFSIMQDSRRVVIQILG